MDERLDKLRILVAMLGMLLAVHVADAQLTNATAAVAYYEFEKGGNDGPYTVRGDAKIVEDAERGSVLSLDGDGDYLDCGNDPAFSITKEITIACWMKVDASSTNIRTAVSKKANKASSWMLGIEGGKVHFYINDARPTERLVGKMNVLSRKWYHIAGAYNGSTMSIFVDGDLDVSAASSGDIILSDTPVWIGDDHEGAGQAGWKGFIDDVAIFNRALSGDEISRLHREGLARFVAGSTLQEFGDLVQKAKTVVEEQRPVEAIAFLQKKIAEHEGWKKENPNHPVLSCTCVSADLYYLLAKTKEAAGAPNEEIADAYRRAIEPDKLSLLSAPRQAPALLWLHKNVDSETYGGIVVPLIQSDRDLLPAVAAHARRMVAEQNSQAAIESLEGNLAAYTRWQDAHPFYDVPAEHSLPEIYFLLAKAREAAGAPKEDIAEAYAKTFVPSNGSYVQERTAALIWLIMNGCVSEYADVIKLQTRDTKGSFAEVVCNVCKDYESKKNWAEFESFLDALFAQAKHPSDWVIVVESSLGGKTNEWAQKYSEYVGGRAALKFGSDCVLAEKYMADKKFEDAGALYLALLGRCGSEDDKGAIEFQLCKCLYEGGKYREALPQLESFIANNKVVSRSLMEEAMLMKARAHMYLGNLEDATDTAFALMMGYPESEDMPEINFRLGYWYMSQNKFKAALNAFDCLVRDYPSSPLADKARGYMARIKNSTE